MNAYHKFTETFHPIKIKCLHCITQKPTKHTVQSHINMTNSFVCKQPSAELDKHNDSSVKHTLFEPTTQWHLHVITEWTIMRHAMMGATTSIGPWPRHPTPTAEYHYDSDNFLQYAHNGYTHEGEILWGVISMALHIEDETKWPPISWHFQMHFLEWKSINFDKDFIEICSQGSNRQYSSIGLLV